MIDHVIWPMQQRLLRSPAKFLVKCGLGADQITLLGFLLGVLVVPALAYEAYSLALIFLLLNRLSDGLDGAVARQSEQSARGAFFDISCDFVFYALFPLGFALAAPVNALPAAVLITSFVGSGSTFLAYAIMDAKRGEATIAVHQKGMYYLSGLTEGFETITLFICMCLFPTYFPYFAYFFAIACVITTLSRWHRGWADF
jgi:phosphatidylglycerophosphate synthase